MTVEIPERQELLKWFRKNFESNQMIEDYEYTLAKTLYIKKHQHETLKGGVSDYSEIQSVIDLVGNTTGKYELQNMTVLEIEEFKYEGCPSCKKGKKKLQTEGHSSNCKNETEKLTTFFVSKAILCDVELNELVMMSSSETEYFSDTFKEGNCISIRFYYNENYREDDKHKGIPVINLNQVVENKDGMDSDLEEIQQQEIKESELPKELKTVLKLIKTKPKTVETVTNMLKPYGKEINDLGNLVEVIDGEVYYIGVE